MNIADLERLEAHLNAQNDPHAPILAEVIDLLDHVQNESEGHAASCCPHCGRVIKE